MNISKKSWHYKFYASLDDVPEDPTLSAYWGWIIATLLVAAAATFGTVLGVLMVWEAFNSSESLHPVHGLVIAGHGLWGLQITTGLFTRIGRRFKAVLRRDDTTTFTD